MARRLRINNPDLTRSEKSYLTSAYSSGTTLNIVNSFAFSADNFAVVGEAGKDEKIEAERITAVPAGGATITLASALSYTYAKDTVVYQSRYDQIAIESNAGSGFSLISTSGIQWDKSQTLYIDPNGGDSTTYRWRFKNSSTGIYSEYSPTLSGAGFTSDQAGYIIRETRIITGDIDGRAKRDKEILRDINRGLEIIYGRLPTAWFYRFEDSSITTIADTDKYNLDLMGSGSAGNPGISIGRIDTVRYRYNSGSTDIIYHLSYLPNIEFDEYVRDNNAPTDDNVEKYTLLDPDSSSVNGYIRVWPKPKNTGSGTFYINGYQKPSIIDGVDDSVILPLPSILIDYCVGQVEKVRGNDTKAQYYEELFYGPPPNQTTNRRLSGIALLEKLNAEQRRPVGQPRQLKYYRGRKAMSRLFGNRAVSRDYMKENFFN